MCKEFNELYQQAKNFLDQKNFIISEKNLKSIIAAKLKGYPLLLVGPTGCGKTLLLTHLAEFFKGDYFYASLNGSVTIHDLTQERVLDKNGAFIEKDMVLAKWLRAAAKNLSILHLDEINAARPETLLALHPIMDLKGELNLPYSDEILKVTNNALLVMSANEGDEYMGINGMNAAFQNRYLKIHLPYIQGKQLTELLTKKTGVPEEQTAKIVKVWTRYMESKQPEQPPVSIRILERWCELSKMLGLRSAGIVTFASLIAQTEDDLAEIIEGDMFINLPE